MLFVVKLFYFVYFVRIGFCYNVIDVDDILSDDLMPGNLLMLENANRSDTKDNITTGSLNDAMSTMDFHRSKMNEYLCRNYLAEQIVQDMTIPTFSRRSSTTPLNSKESLMIDEGSKSYKDWLSKSATLEDIYRHYNTQSNPTQSRRNDEVRNEEENEEYDTHVTNYVYEHPAKHTTYNLYGSGSGYGLATPSLSYYPSILNGNSNYGTVSVHSYDSNHANQNYSPKYNKEKDVTDLFDIALTALAYLSFGMFIVHVVMCIAAVTNNTTTVVTMMPMSMGPEPTGEVEEAVRIKDNLNFRHKRQVQSDININELARKILTSIEAALVANEDKGSCLRLQLCENNKYSRGLNDNGKLWIPVWSLGMSWLSGKLIKNVPAATSMLDGLKASILGLGKANCDRIYKDCNLHDERIKQKVKRKK
nr:uncharacterized protein LOC111420619 [Onthophagus taurus]